MSTVLPPLAISNGQLSINLTAYSSTVAMNTAISNVLAGYTDTVALAALLSGKLGNLTAGANISITGSGTSRTISANAGGAPLILQLDGVTQAAATTLDFVGNNASADESSPNLHSPYFNFNDDALPTSIETMATIAMRFLEGA